MFDILRLVSPDGGQHKGTAPCTADGCTKSTREGKPFCSAHIEQSPYVAEILQTLAKRDAEEATLDRMRGRVPNDGFFYRETLLLLRSKDYTTKGLARRLDISHKAAERLIALITGDKLAKRSVTSRGDTIISGIGDRDLAFDRD